MNQVILRLPDVKNRTGLSRSTIYNAMKSGDFPCPINLGARAVGWISSDIDEWISTRISRSVKQVVVRNRITRR